MSKILIRLIIALAISGIFNQRAAAQNNEPTSLEGVLKVLETRYNVRFSYNPNALAKLLTSIPNEQLSLNEALEFISTNTAVSFTILNERFIAVKVINWSETFLDQTLDEVLITNYITSGVSKKSLGSFNIQPEKFGILPGLVEPDILLILQSLPGITSTDETVSNLNVRGGTNDQNLIIFDGMKMYQSGHFFIFIPSKPDYF